MLLLLYTVLCLTGLVAAAPQPQGCGGGVSCRVEYTTAWDTEYRETESQECVIQYQQQCTTLIERQCQPTPRQECSTVYEKQCATVYKSVCEDQTRTVYEPYTETECSTEYKEDCEYQWQGEGNNKVRTRAANEPSPSLKCPSPG